MSHSCDFVQRETRMSHLESASRARGSHQHAGLTSTHPRTDVVAGEIYKNPGNLLLDVLGCKPGGSERCLELLWSRDGRRTPWSRRARGTASGDGTHLRSWEHTNHMLRALANTVGQIISRSLFPRHHGAQSASQPAAGGFLQTNFCVSHLRACPHLQASYHDETSPSQYHIARSSIQLCATIVIAL